MGNHYERCPCCGQYTSEYNPCACDRGACPKCKEGGGNENMLTERDLRKMKDMYSHAQRTGNGAESKRLKKIIDMNEGRYVARPRRIKYKEMN